MTVSTFDAIATATRRMLATLGFLALALGCRPGLPPEPAGQNAADAGAPTPKYQPRPSPNETSAFEGVRIDGAGGHEGMNHGGKPMEKKEMPADKPVSADPHEGMDMPADKPKPGERAEVPR